MFTCIFFNTVILLLTYTSKACEQLYYSSFQDENFISFRNYRDNEDECYVIQATLGKRVKVNSNGDLQTDGCNDTLEIRCGKNANGEKIDTYCEGDRVNDVVSGSRHLYIRWRSDSNNTGYGFILHYREVSGSEKPDCKDPNKKIAYIAAIVGGVVGGVVFIGIVSAIVIGCVCMQRASKRRQTGTLHNPVVTSHPIPQHPHANTLIPMQPMGTPMPPSQTNPPPYSVQPVGQYPTQPTTGNTQGYAGTYQ